MNNQLAIRNAVALMGYGAIHQRVKDACAELILEINHLQTHQASQVSDRIAELQIALRLMQELHRCDYNVTRRELVLLDQLKRRVGG